MKGIDVEVDYSSLVMYEYEYCNLGFLFAATPKPNSHFVL